jgi:Flp pilus assembly protein TadD
MKSKKNERFRRDHPRLASQVPEAEGQAKGPTGMRSSPPPAKGPSVEKTKGNLTFLRRIFKRHWILSFLLVITVMLVYLPVRHQAFVNFDDPGYVTENPMVQAGLTWTGIQWAFTTLDESNWHPLTWLSHMLDCQLFGLNAGGHHLVSVLFHATNAVLLFWLLLRMTGACWQSAFIAALFAWHPLRVESVAWVAERKDVLSAFFGLLTLLMYARYVEKSKVQDPKSKVPYALALLFFALGLMAKPMLVTLPFVFLLLDYWPLQRAPNYELRLSRWLRLVWEKWPFFVLAAASCVVTFVAQKRGAAVAPLETYPLSARIGNAAVAYVEYLVKSVYPVNLAVIYPLPQKKIPWEQVAGAILVLAVISWLIWRARRQRPYLLTGWFWYLGMLVPVVGLVQVGSQAMADRYTYLPLIGVSIGVVFGLGDLAVRLRLKSTVLIPVVVVVLGGCLFATARQLQYWRDGETLFRHALAVTKDNPLAQSSLGVALGDAGHLQEAIEHFREALRLQPDDAPAHNNLGVALTKTGHPQEAMEHFREALRLQPDNATAHNYLGVALLQTGQPQKAIEHLQEALRLKPDSAIAHYNLGNVLLQTGQLQEAIKHYQEALRLKPDDAMTHSSLGVALVQTGQLQEAIKHYQEALRLQPNLPEAHCNLGITLTEVGRPTEAITHFEQALQLQPNYPKAHNGLGLALLQNGQVDEAIAQFRTALQLQPSFAAARNYLGDALLHWGQELFQKGQMNQAIAPLQEGLQIHPENIGAYNHLGIALLQNGQIDQAVVQFQKALAVQPDNVEAQNNLAWVWATCPDASLRNGVKAVALARQANQLSGGQNPAILGTLAAAFAEAGHFPQAVTTAQKALQLIGSQTNAAPEVNDLLAQIKCYQAGSPFRDRNLTTGL